MGILLEVLMIVVFVCICIFFFAQIIVPLIEGTRLFPVFRKRGEVIEELVEAKEELATEKLKKEVKNVKGKIKKEREDR